MSNFGYKEMLGIRNPFKPNDELLDKLALCMSGFSRYPDRNMFRVENLVETAKTTMPPIPAGYTYFGQFIDHDISLDSLADDANTPPWEDIDPRGVKNLRSPDFNLETVYGIGTPDSRNEFPPPELMQENSRMFLRLGDTQKDPFLPGNSKNSYPNDLPRKKGSVEASIVDLRNDENLVIAQTQVAFIKFHNAIVLKLKHSGKYKNEEETFKKARKIAIRHYQYIILEIFEENS
jgi:hypothetical protein